MSPLSPSSQTSSGSPPEASRSARQTCRKSLCPLALRQPRRPSGDSARFSTSYAGPLARPPLRASKSVTERRTHARVCLCVFVWRRCVQCKGRCAARVFRTLRAALAKAAVRRPPSAEAAECVLKEETAPMQVDDEAGSAGGWERKSVSCGGSCAWLWTFAQQAAPQSRSRGRLRNEKPLRLRFLQVGGLFSRETQKRPFAAKAPSASSVFADGEWIVLRAAGERLFSKRRPLFSLESLGVAASTALFAQRGRRRAGLLCPQRSH